MLDSIQRAQLHVTVGEDGFKVIQKIFESELAKFHIRLLNTNPADEAAVLAAHKMEKAAAQFYQGVVNRINSELEIYRSTPKSTDKPEDVTEGVLDIDEMALSLENIPNLIGEGN